MTFGFSLQQAVDAHVDARLEQNQQQIWSSREVGDDLVHVAVEVKALLKLCGPRERRSRSIRCAN